MRAPYQALVLPYKKEGNEILYCVFHRADNGWWQFVSGGGEDDEQPIETAKREVFEECGIKVDDMATLISKAYIPTNIFSPKYLEFWGYDRYVIPEHAFAFECRDEIILSEEHTECRWLSYEDARKLLTYDSNRTAMYELSCRIRDGKI